MFVMLFASSIYLLKTTHGTHPVLAAPTTQACLRHPFAVHVWQFKSMPVPWFQAHLILQIPFTHVKA